MPEQLHPPLTTPKTIRKRRPMFGRRLKKPLRWLLWLLRGQPDKFLVEVSGVIHIGANAGQERDRYSDHGLRVLWIEPIPAVFERLLANIRDYPNQQAIQALVTDVDGKMYDFHIANNDGQSSSILELQEHRDVWPEIHYTATLNLESATLPTLLAEYGIDAADYQALILDTQGSELLILHGALQLLTAFRFIKVEASDFEAYKGCCQVHDIAGLLKPLGFEERSRVKFASHPNGGSCFDIVYEAKTS